MFSFFVNELAVELSKNGECGIQLTPGANEIYMLLFADDVIGLSSTPAALQNQLNHLQNEVDRLYFTVNLDKTNTIVFCIGGHLDERERWLYDNEDVKVTYAFQYWGITFTTNPVLTL